MVDTEDGIMKELYTRATIFLHDGPCPRSDDLPIELEALPDRDQRGSSPARSSLLVARLGVDGCGFGARCWARGAQMQWISDGPMASARRTGRVWGSFAVSSVCRRGGKLL